MEPFRSVMVALSRTESDRELLRYARRLSEIRPEAEFYFVHVLDWPSPGQDPATVVSHERARTQIQQAVLEDFGPTGFCRVLHGSKIDRLLEFAAEEASDLVMVGHRRTLGGRRSLARRLAMQAPCSVWMVPEASGPSIRGVLAGIDFSEASALALCTATLIAHRLGLSECVALHVIGSPFIAGLDDETIGRGHEMEAFSRFIAPLELHGVRVRPIFEEGSNVSRAAERIAAAEKADLVIMGTRGQSRSASILLGAESEQMLMESRVPVLVVKQTGGRIGLLQALFDRELTARVAPRAS